MQNWRAVAHFKNGKDALVILGISQYQVTTTYHEAFLDVIHPELQSICTGISLQRWRGKPDRGNWLPVGTLKIPGCR